MFRRETNYTNFLLRKYPTFCSIATYNVEYQSTLKHRAKAKGKGLRLTLYLAIVFSSMMLV